MTVEWLQPVALWGLAGLTLPVLVHLLARDRTRRLPFPTLRFLAATRLTSRRSRAIADWPLLVVRLLLLAAAVGALAGPVLITDSRRAEWDRRVARAVVLATPVSADAAALAADEAADTYAHAEFAVPSIVDGLHEAVNWLARQAPAAREIVVIGDLRAGTLDERDVALVPPHVGLRLLPMPDASSGTTFELSGVADADGAVGGYDVAVTPEPSSTRVAYQISKLGAPPPIEIVAAPEEQDYADALLRAVLREGVLLDRAGSRRLTIGFAGASLSAPEALEPPRAPWMIAALSQHAGLRGGEHDGALVIRAAMPVTDPRAPSLVAAVVASAFDVSFEPREPRRIDAATLARWSRPPGGSPAGAVPGDEGDRRWFWAAALALLGLEQVLRRRTAPREARDGSTPPDRRRDHPSGISATRPAGATGMVAAMSRAARPASVDAAGAATVEHRDAV